ncbi:MAG: TolC family protein [Verrucomicrobiales bacterium]
MKLYLAFCFFAAAAWSSSAQTDTNAVYIKPIVVTPEYISSLTKEAREQNPLLSAAASRVQAAEANSKSIPLFSDPNLIVGGMAAERMMRMEDGDLSVGIEQELPLFRKPWARRKLAQSEAAGEQAQAATEQSMVSSELARTLFRVALADTTTAIAKEDQQWRETILAVAEERYRLGQAAQIDLLRLQNERSAQAERVKTEMAKREREAATVNRLLNRYPLSYVPPLGLPTNSIPLPQHDTLYLAALRNGPQIQALKSQVAKAEAQFETTKTESHPDVMVGVQSRYYSRTPDWRSTDVMLKVSIPLLNRSSYKKARQRDLHQKEAAEKMLLNGRNEINETIHHLMVEIDAAQREAALFANEIIPRTEQTLDNARAAWQNNNDSLRDVLEARRMLLEAQLMHARAVAEQWSGFAELAAVCGLSDLNGFHALLRSENGNINSSATNP